jgi:hypothetical protein
MSKVNIIRYQTRPEAAEENQRLVEAVFAELADSTPNGLRYTAFRLADGVTFVHVVVSEGEDNPLPTLAAFKKFQENMGERVAGPPVFEEATVVGEYR